MLWFLASRDTSAPLRFSALIAGRPRLNVRVDSFVASILRSRTSSSLSAYGDDIGNDEVRGRGQTKRTHGDPRELSAKLAGKSNIPECSETPRSRGRRVSDGGGLLGPGETVVRYRQESRAQDRVPAPWGNEKPRHQTPLPPLLAHKVTTNSQAHTGSDQWRPRLSGTWRFFSDVSLCSKHSKKCFRFVAARTPEAVFTSSRKTRPLILASPVPPRKCKVT